MLPGATGCLVSPSLQVGSTAWMRVEVHLLWPQNRSLHQVYPEACAVELTEHLLGSITMCLGPLGLLLADWVKSGGLVTTPTAGLHPQSFRVSRS